MKLESKDLSVRTLLGKDKNFEVPSYQRNYAWTTSEIDEFITDLERTKTVQTEHFLGVIVLVEETDHYEIIDGQQRLTTIFLFLYALLEKYKLINIRYGKDTNKRRQKLEELLVLCDDDGEVISPRLILNDFNRDFFNEYIVNGWDKSEQEREDIYATYKKRKINICDSLRNNYLRISQWLDDKLKQSSDIDALLDEFRDLQTTILDAFTIVYITVGDTADAFLIFETLNDRGLALSHVDLIKNELFKNCSKDKSTFEKYKDSWADMMNRLEDIDKVKKFIKHYWIAYRGEIRGNNLFKTIRDYLKGSREKSQEIIEELKEYSYFYDILINPSQTNINSSELLEILNDINQLSYDLTHPIMLAAYKFHKNDEVALSKIAILCRNFLLRHITIGKNKPTAIEGAIGEIARQYDGKISLISEAFKKINKDSEFKENLKVCNLNQRSYSTYLLLVNYERTLHNEEWALPEKRRVTIEHILPQTLDNTNWVSIFTREQHEVFVNRLGNLTLLGAKINSAAQNKDFLEKLKIYKEKKTEIIMTKELEVYSQWTEVEIQDRQNKLAEKICGIFSLEI